MTDFYLYLLVFVFSLIVGSFLNVLIYRLPLMLEGELLADCRSLLHGDLPKDQPKKLNLFFPRSFCVHCQEQVKAIHNVPLLSFCLLGGRCYFCKGPIALQYPIVELLSGLLGLLAAYYFGLNGSLLFVLCFLWILIALFFIDLQKQILPDVLTLLLLWIGLIANTEGLFVPLQQAVLSTAGAYLSLWLFIKIYFLLTGKIGMGHGDFKLFAALAAWFGWQALPFVLVASSFLGALFGLVFLKIQKKPKDTPIPFGPFLCVSGLVFLFWGTKIVDFYQQLF